MRRSAGETALLTCDDLAGPGQRCGSDAPRFGCKRGIELADASRPIVLKDKQRNRR